jgi:Uma2 family endonuclease
MVVSSSQRILTDTWVKATWDEFVSLAYDDPTYKEGRAYFDAGYMRIEMASLGVGHGRQNGIAWDVITLFVTVRKLDIAKYMNTSFRKAGEREFQPDAAFYIGDAAKYLPPQNNSPVNIDLSGPPTLVVEVGASSLSDDLGAKRLLYERVGVKEYWVVDVEGQKVVAFSIESGRSGQIQTSGVLPGLDISVIEEAVRRSQSENDGAIAQWLMKTFE